LQGKFLAITVPLVLASTLVLFALFEANTHRVALQQLEQNLEKLVARQSAVLSAPLWNLDDEQIDLTLAAIFIDRDVVSVKVYDEAGNVFDEIGQTGTTGERTVVLAKDIVFAGGGENKVVGRLEIGVTDQWVWSATKSRLLVAGAIAFLVVVAVVISALVGHYRIIGRPLERLLASIEQAKRTGIREVVDWRSEDEVGTVITAFNEMQLRQDAYEAELHSARDELEQRVEKRTAELAATRDEALRARTQLTDAVESLPEAFSLFDADDRLILYNRKYQEMYADLDIPVVIGDRYERILRAAIDKGLVPDIRERPQAWLEERLQKHRNPGVPYEQPRAGGRWLNISERKTEEGGTVAIFTDITEIKGREEQLRVAKEQAERALIELEQAQAILVQTQKMASLGHLTAGIAHEIKNPLNFVNNFAEMSAELLAELKEEIEPSLATLAHNVKDDALDLFNTLNGNLAKIKEHGTRADKIVKGMLSHAREGPSTAGDTNLNVLLEESLNLAYHGMRAEYSDFSVTMEKDFDDAVGEIELFPQEITRVFLNVISNGFYTVHQRRLRSGGADYKPALKISTRDLGEHVEVRIRDNGTGIPPSALDKIFDPFFTTKPTGEGTGLGLSLSYETVVQQHHGRFDVATKEGEFSEFVITLPRKATHAVATKG
jgi:signal transduction histidine kinase